MTNTSRPQAVTLSATSAEAQYIADTFKSRKKNIDQFNQACSSFIDLLVELNAVPEFLALLKKETMKGMMASDQSTKEDKDIAALIFFYHTKYHAAEMAHDVRELAENYYQRKHPDQALSDSEKIYIAFFEMCAAWHDETQGKRKPTTPPMINETLSAQACAKSCSPEVKALGERLMQQHPEQADKIQKIFNDFETAIPFMADELIVAPTYLVMSKDAVIPSEPGNANKPLLYFMYQAEEKISESDKNLPTSHLQAGRILTSFSDTMRSLIKKELANLHLVKQVHAMDEKFQSVIAKLAKALNLNDDPALEGFLLKMGQNIRMSTELNKFYKDNARVPDTELKEDLIAALDNMRTGEPASKRKKLPKPYRDYLDILMLDKIAREAAFAGTLDANDHIAMTVVAKCEGALLPEEIDTQGWKAYGKKLEEFQKFYKGLPPEEQDILAHGLFYLAANQPGVGIYKEYEHELALNQEKRKRPKVPGVRTSALGMMGTRSQGMSPHSAKTPSPVSKKQPGSP